MVGGGAVTRDEQFQRRLDSIGAQQWKQLAERLHWSGTEEELQDYLEALYEKRRQSNSRDCGPG